MEDKLDKGYRHAMAAKELIFKAQDEINYVDGLREAEDALLDLRNRLEAFDRLCRRLKREGV